MHYESHTAAQFMSLAEAYDYLNATLFDGALPQCLVTFTRKAKVRGYYWPAQFRSRADRAAPAIPEIAMNPDHFKDRSDQDIFSTLAHEMVHHWRHVHGGGKPPKGGYHCKVWAEKMKLVGLHPSDTGLPGGKEIGPAVTHYIVEAGPFARAFATLAARGVRIDWESMPQDEAKKAKKRASKTKYTCASCEAAVWGKPATHVTCTPCDMPMLADDAEGDDDNDA